MTPPTLDPRFQEPPNWRWHSFTRANRAIRFGSVFPQNSMPDAVVVCLQGVREFSEKYFETARWCLDHNLAFWTFDWAGQGKSTRFIPHKRHTEGFAADILDLDYFIREYIKHAAVHPDRGRIPLVMLAHSMGANLGLRYIQDHPERFSCAAFTAPMMGIKKFQNIPQSIASLATVTAALIMGKSYIIGGHDWVSAPLPPEETLTGDRVRAKIHNQWGESDPSLMTGSVTYRWLQEAQKSCMALRPVAAPCLFALPGHEHLVDNARARRIIAPFPQAQTLEMPEAHHEILMERDPIRTEFLAAFYTLIEENVINRPETLKPF